MDFFELVKMSTQHLELTSPTAPEKLWTIGQYLNLNDEKKVIDFGCGYGRTLAMWAEDFGISGTGVEIHPFMCKKAAERMENSQLTDRVEIKCDNPLDFKLGKSVFDVAVCLGASFIWGGYQQALSRMDKSINQGGKLVIGEPYFTKEGVPSELIKFEGDLHNEYQLMGLTRQAGFDVEFVIRASRDDWDRYVSSNWYGLLQWIDNHPDHHERQYVIDYLHRRQDIYFRYQREFEDWVIYILNRRKY